MKKRMKMAAAVMAAVMGMMTLGGCGTASEKSETAAQAEGTDAKQTSEEGKSQDLKEINVVLTGIRMRSIPLFIRRSSAVIMRKKDWM